jgi:hypothetical protein
MDRATEIANTTHSQGYYSSSCKLICAQIEYSIFDCE